MTWKSPLRRLTGEGRLAGICPSALDNGDVLAVHLREHRREGVVMSTRSAFALRDGRRGFVESTSLRYTGTRAISRAGAELGRVVVCSRRDGSAVSSTGDVLSRCAGEADAQEKPGESQPGRGWFRSTQFPYWSGDSAQTSSNAELADSAAAEKEVMKRSHDLIG
jgi:hypothetical protein